MAVSPRADDNRTRMAAPKQAGMGPVSTLIVDDDADLRRLARLVLEETGDSLVVVGEVGSGVEALAVIDDCDPDVVVVDLNMPGWDGLETARAIRTRRPDQPIVLWSAYLTPASRGSAEAEGIVSCVAKGDLGQLAAEIRRLGRQ